MKDSEFIELLNLYLDHEISAEDATRLEVEVQQNPARRRLYQQYCRVQKACTILAKDYVEQAASSSAAEDRKVVAFASSRPWGAGVYAGGLALAAACVALVVIANRSNHVAPVSASPQTVATVTSAAAMPVEAKSRVVPTGVMTQDIAQAVPASTPRGEMQPVFTAAPLSRAKNNAGAALANGDAQALETQLDWIREMQFAPIQRTPAGQLRYDPKADFKGAPRTFGPGRLQTDVQNAAFQFQR